MRNDRWATDKEITSALPPDDGSAGGGPVLYCRNGKRFVYTGESHSIFQGVSGAGKTRRGIIPMLFSLIGAGESFTVCETKGEIYAATADRLSGYDVHIIDFRNICFSEGCNLFAYPAELWASGKPELRQVSAELVDDISANLYPYNNDNPFWVDSARSLMVGAAYAIMQYGTPSQLNIKSIYSFVADGDERGSGFAPLIKEFCDLIPRDNISAMLLRNYVTTASDTRGGIRSTFLEALSLYNRSPELLAMTCANGPSDLRISELDGERRTAIYVILPDETAIFDKLGAVIIEQLMTHYVRIAHDRYGGRLPRRMNFIVEEAGNIGKISSLPHLLSAGRSRNIRASLVLQNTSQLRHLYGDAAETILSNADLLIAYRTNHWETLTELSNKCGTREVDRGGSYVRENLISPSQLGAMKTGQALVMLGGGLQFVTFLPDYTDMFDCSTETSYVPERPRAARDGSIDLFDLRAFIEKMKPAPVKKRSSGAPSREIGDIMERLIGRPEPDEKPDKDGEKS